MLIRTTPKFNKSLRKYSHLESVIDQKIQLFMVDPQHPSLRLHKLTGKLQNYYSISINMSLRITLYFEEDGSVTLSDIGTHAIYG